MFKKVLLALCFAAWFARPVFCADAGAPPGMPDAPAAPLLQSWLALAESPPVLLLIAATLVQILKFLNDRKVLDAQRWQGLVQSLYNQAENAGFNLNGPDKLKLALADFENEYIKTFNSVPAKTDYQDVKLDLAIAAAADKSAPPAPSLSPVPVTIVAPSK